MEKSVLIVIGIVGVLLVALVFWKGGVFGQERARVVASGAVEVEAAEQFDDVDPTEEYPCNNCEQGYAKYGGLPNDQGDASKLLARTDEIMSKCRSLSTLGVLM